MSTTTAVPAWTLGDRLRKARGHRTQESMGFELGKKPSTIGTWENDVHKPDFVLIEKWAEITETPVWWLLGYDYEPNRYEMLDRLLRNKCFREYEQLRFVA